MHIKEWLIIATTVALPCGTALGQDAQPAPQPQPQTSAASTDENRWVASGFVGSNFGNNAQSASVNYGGSVAYLWKNMYGAELDTGFTPSFQLQNNFFGTGIKPDVNSYMANAVWAKPIGDEGRFQPFVSGGVGAISLRSGLGVSNGTIVPNDTRFGGDIGGGLMAFSGYWGIKADVRYLRATGTYNNTVAYATPTPSPTPTPGPYGTTSTSAGTTAATPSPAATTPPTAATTSLAGAALSGLHFWRANIGVALRW